jgi:hypothetical protein
MVQPRMARLWVVDGTLGSIPTGTAVSAAAGEPGRGARSRVTATRSLHARGAGAAGDIPVARGGWHSAHRAA